MSRKKPSYDELLERCRKAEAAIVRYNQSPKQTTDRNNKGIRLLEMAKTQRRAAHIKQVLLAIRNVNQLIAQIDNPGELIKRICRTLTDTMGYYSAWMALINPDTQELTHTAESDYGELFYQMRPHLEKGHYPRCMKQALSSSQLVVIEKLTEDCIQCSLHPQHKRCSRLVERIEHHGRVYGVLAVSVPSRYAQEQEEQTLFSEVVSDIAFALNKLETELERSALQQEQVHLLDSMMNAFVVLKGVFNSKKQLVDCRIEYTNKVFNQMHAVTATEVKGKLFTELWPKSEKTWIENYRKIINTGKPQRFIRTNRIQGSTHKCIAYCPWEKRDRFCVIIEDITQKKKQEEAIQKSKEQLQSLVCNIPGITYRCKYDKDWTFIYVNAVNNTIGGYPVSDFLNNNIRSFASIIHPKDTKDVWKQVSTAIKKNQSWEQEYRLIHKDGSIHWVYEKGQAIKHKNKVTYLDGFIIDITERKQALEDLAARETFLNRVIDQSPFASFICDDKGLLQRANPALKNILNLTDEQLVGKYNVLNDPITKKQGLLPLFRSVYKEGKTINFTCEWDGNYIPDLDLKGSNAVSIEAAMFPIQNNAGKVTNVVVNWIDVTKRKQAEEALKFQAKVLNQIHDLITVTDMDGNITYVNDAECRMLNIPREKLIGKSVSIYGNEPGSSATQEEIIAHVNKHGEWRGDMINHRPDGTKIVLDCRIFTLHDENGNPTSMCGISSDITQRKKTEEALRFQAEVLNQIHDRITITDTKGIITYVNDSECRTMGLKKEELIGKHVLELYGNNPGSSATQQELIENTLKYGTWRCDLINYTKDNKKSVIDCRLFALLDEHKNISNICGISTDITQRKKTEEALRASEEKFRTIFQNAPLGLFRSTVKGRFIEVNPAFAALFGYDSPEEMVKQVKDISKEIYENKNDRQKVVKHQLESDNMTVHQTNCKRKDGAILRANIHVKAIRNNNGEVLYLEGILEDITERAHAEEEKAKLQAQLFQAQKMESLGGLAAGMAHEINNPLGIILQTSQNINRRLDPAFPKNQAVSQEVGLDLEVMGKYLQQREIYDSVDTVRQAAQRAAGIVRNMLNFSRKDSTGMQAHDINTILDNSIDIAGKDYDLKKKYDFHQINIHKEYSQLPPTICADMEIGQVFLNIIKNAAQAMFAYGTKNPELRIRTSTKDNYTCIEIQDNGPGMNHETKKRIFEPFFTTKAPGQGTGLGLSVSYFIIDNHHNGHIKLKSSPDKGTTFIIELPITQTKK